MSEAAVLLVDDDAPIRRMLERTLSAEGYAVAAVADGGAALAEVERSVPDVIVLDVAMPGIDGLSVTRRLRAKGLPVPILPPVAGGRDAGANRFIFLSFRVSYGEDHGCARRCCRAVRTNPGAAATNGITVVYCTTELGACSAVMAWTGEVMMCRPPERISTNKPTPIQPTLRQLPPMLAPSIQAGVGWGKKAPP